MTIQFAGENVGLLAILIVNFLLGLTLGIAAFGALQLNSRFRGTDGDSTARKALLKITSLFVILSVSLALVVLPATLWTNAPAYYSDIGVFVLFATLVPITIVAIIKANNG